MSDELTTLLATDPEAAKCYRCLTGAEEMTLDGIAARYGAQSEPESPAQQLARVLGVTVEQAESACTPAEAEEELLWEQWKG